MAQTSLGAAASLRRPWVYLIFDYLKSEGFKKSKKGVQSAIKSLPTTVSQVYQKIFSKSKDQPIVRRVLAVLLAAGRALTVLELNIATEIQGTTQSWEDLDLEKEEDFKSRLRSWCGLFISVYDGKVYFLHQIAREFLLADVSPSTSVPQKVRWEHSIAMHHAHKILAEYCLHYISFYSPLKRLGTNNTWLPGARYFGTESFFHYSRKFWMIHFREAELNTSKDAVLFKLGLKVSNPESLCFPGLTGMHASYYSYDVIPEHHLTIVSSFGHDEIVQMLLDKGANANAQGGKYYGNALHAASFIGHERVVELLFNAGANVNDRVNDLGESSSSALRRASRHGYERIVDMLLNASALYPESSDNDSVKSSDGETPWELLP
ncbi:hypothetical protein COCSADRAFT_297447 [Bipolaris sorokiniana ND90Pr]|uniref:Uncharacterized protein n=1 Tax=Cochliobolus sativus (strain ND90Pr / ATCC 201652) TaxID=665912 RepID=M2SGG7_COCSN|nr:uncharacterized protein COCSADRAFT_297447 [Bipolaris sorokiniana ND90Pr]EMD66338.1 hypothetical protein COCSADRAFT_297447 [Bipolaris sorokiniana ND90Pr]